MYLLFLSSPLTLGHTVINQQIVSSRLTSFEFEIKYISFLQKQVIAVVKVIILKKK